MHTSRQICGHSLRILQGKKTPKTYVQEMYPNDEEGSVGDLQAFIVDTLTKHQKMKKFYEE